jgi:hypothetical protein
MRGACGVDGLQLQIMGILSPPYLGEVFHQVLQGGGPPAPPPSYNWVTRVQGRLLNSPLQCRWWGGVCISVCRPCCRFLKALQNCVQEVWCMHNHQHHVPAGDCQAMRAAPCASHAVRASMHAALWQCVRWWYSASNARMHAYQAPLNAVGIMSPHPTHLAGWAC